MGDNLYISNILKSAITLEDLNLQIMCGINVHETSAQPTDHDYVRTAVGSIHHRHLYSELFACVSGELLINTENGALQLNAGDLVVIPPNVPHVLIPGKPEDKRGVVSFIGQKRQIPNCQPLYGCCTGFFAADAPLMLRGQPALCAKVMEIIDDLQQAAEYLPTLKLAELLLTIRKTQMDSQPASTGPEENELSRISVLEQLINSCFTKPVTVEQIAEKMYISSRQLSRIIKTHYGTTLHELIIARRIAVAEHLLGTTDLTMEEIAETIGFGSRTGFYREFVKRHGVTPVQYRRSLEFSMTDFPQE